MSSSTLPPTGAVASARGSSLRVGRAITAGALLALSACDHNQSTGPVQPGPVASIVVSPASWAPTWVLARQQFTATARDARGRTVPGTIVWSYTDPNQPSVDSVARVTSDGIATSLSLGSGHLIATLDGVSDSVPVTVTSSGDPTAYPSGLMWTVWFARSDSAPALLVDGRLITPDQYYDEPAHPDNTLWALPNVAKFAAVADRFGVLTDVVGGAGNFRVRDRVGEWTDLATGNAVDFAMSGNMIGLLTSDGVLQAKDGTDGPWAVLATSGVKDWKIRAGQLIGLLSTDGTLQMKDGVNGTWATLATSGVRKFDMASGGLIGMLTDGGELQVKSGINGTWADLADSGAVDFALAGNRIGMLLSDGTFEVKDGIDGTWTVLATGGVRQFALEGDRIAVVLPDGSFQAKDGINGTWVQLASGGVRDIKLQGNAIGMLTTAGELDIKLGINGTWKTGGPYGNSVSQYQLMVNVPVPPVRITPDLYYAALQQCDSNAGGVDCYSPADAAIPVPHYGRFCGAGVPTSAQWDAAVALGPIDGMDALCMHHDLSTSWYPEASGTDACVVRYGLHYSRVTNNGVLLADGSSDSNTWDAAWGSAMPNLKDAVDRYFTWAGAGCTDKQLSDFTDATAGQ